MRCNHCGNILEESKTTFTVVKDNDVYVVKSVPCLECPVCGHVSYTQSTSKKLDRYVSGGVSPAKQSMALIFIWGDPVEEILRERTTNRATRSRTFVRRGTASPTAIPRGHLRSTRRRSTI
jgi:YgiT-type zinc finger domain-containing protein